MKQLFMTALLLAGIIPVTAQETTGSSNEGTLVVDNRAGGLLGWVCSNGGRSSESEIKRLKLRGQMDGADLMWLNFLVGGNHVDNEVIYAVTAADLHKLSYGYTNVPTEDPIPWFRALEELDFGEVSFTEGCYLVADWDGLAYDFQSYYLQRDTIGPYWLDATKVINRLVLPATTKALGPNAFFLCTQLTDLVLPQSMETFCFESLPYERKQFKRIECRSEVPPVVKWYDTKKKPSFQNCTTVTMEQPSDVEEWHKKMAERYGQDFLDNVEIIVPHGSREKYASATTGTLFSLFKKIIEEGEDTSVSSPQTAPATADTRSYTLGGQPATPQTRGIVVSQGHKRVK